MKKSAPKSAIKHKVPDHSAARAPLSGVWQKRERYVCECSIHRFPRLMLYPRPTAPPKSSARAIAGKKSTHSTAPAHEVPSGSGKSLSRSAAKGIEKVHAPRAVARGADDGAADFGITAHAFDADSEDDWAEAGDFGAENDENDDDFMLGSDSNDEELANARLDGEAPTRITTAAPKATKEALQKDDRAASLPSHTAKPLARVVDPSNSTTGALKAGPPPSAVAPSVVSVLTKQIKPSVVEVTRAPTARVAGPHSSTSQSNVSSRQSSRLPAPTQVQGENEAEDEDDDEDDADYTGDGDDGEDVDEDGDSSDLGSSDDDESEGSGDDEGRAKMKLELGSDSASGDSDASGDDDDYDEAGKAFLSKAQKSAQKYRGGKKATEAGDSELSSDDEANDDEFEETGGDIEVAQAKLAELTRRNAADGAMQLHLAAAEGEERFSLPTADDLAAERAAPPNLPAIRRRVNDIIAVLSDFRTRREPGVSRGEYLSLLTTDIAEYYGYNAELVELFLGLFSPAEALAFFEANEAPRPVVIRVNTLKTRRRDLAQALVARGVQVEPVGAWSKVGLKVFESPVPVGATPEYLAGHYMLQSAASFVPVIALGPRPGERVLDMCAAPGGKTSYIAQLMENCGVLVANDLKRDRLPALYANLARLGVTCAVVSAMDGRSVPGAMKGFDRVLLDAPCTGLGVVSRDPSIKLSKGRGDVIRQSHLQKQLILAAIDALEVAASSGSSGSGILVYSTCSVAVEENEAVVAYALRKRHVRMVPLFEPGQPDVGRPGLVAHTRGTFPPSLSLSRRYYPHEHNMDGFFAAKLIKTAHGERGGSGSDEESDEGGAVDGSDEGDGELDDVDDDGGDEEEAAEEDDGAEDNAESASGDDSAEEKEAALGRKAHLQGQPEAVKLKQRVSASNSSKQKQANGRQVASAKVVVPTEASSPKIPQVSARKIAKQEAWQARKAAGAAAAAAVRVASSKSDGKATAVAAAAASAAAASAAADASTAAAVAVSRRKSAVAEETLRDGVTRAVVPATSTSALPPGGSSSKRKRLPAESLTNAERGMQAAEAAAAGEKVEADAAAKVAASAHRSSLYEAAKKAGGSTQSVKPTTSGNRTGAGSISKPVGDSAAKRQRKGPLDDGATLDGGRGTIAIGSGVGTVSFLRPGEEKTLGKKKRKAGRRVQEAKEKQSKKAGGRRGDLDADGVDEGGDDE